MKTLIVIILVLGFSTAVFCQKHYLGFKGGLSYANIYTQGIGCENSTKPRLGLYVASTYDFQITRKFYFGAELAYNQRGRILDVTGFSGSIPTSKYHVLNEVLIENYLSLPLKVGYKFGNKMYGFVDLGIVPSVLLDAKSKVTTYDSTGAAQVQPVKNTTSLSKGFDLASVGNIGMGWRVTKQYNICLSFAYLYGITNLYYNHLAVARHTTASFTVGVTYAIH